MTLEDYQGEAVKTAIYPGMGTVQGLCYVGLGLGEAGETQNKIKKVLRDDKGVLTDQKRLEIAKELGGTLWYIAMCAREIGFSLDTIGQMNIQELKSRQERGVIQGSGDNR